MDKSGKHRVVGDPGLKQGQACPDGYGIAVAEAHLSTPATGQVSSWQDLTEIDPWKDAQLEHSIEFGDGRG